VTYGISANEEMQSEVSSAQYSAYAEVLYGGTISAHQGYALRCVTPTVTFSDSAAISGVILSLVVASKPQGWVFSLAVTTS
jgi:hypothetical protein